jgi:16S rRNA processing protein RimM
MKADLVAIGKISKPHGIRGALKVMPYFQLDHLLPQFQRFWLVQKQQTRLIQPQWFRRSGRSLLLKIEGIDDLISAEGFRGWEISVDRDQLPELPGGQYYTFQLVGLPVITLDGRRIGTIRQVLPMPAHDVYLVDADGKEVIIPAVREFIEEVNLAEKRVVIRTIEGLLE